jgi:hypothetical protein
MHRCEKGKKVCQEGVETGVNQGTHYCAIQMPKSQASKEGEE